MDLIALDRVASKKGPISRMDQEEQKSDQQQDDGYTVSSLPRDAFVEAADEREVMRPRAMVRWFATQMEFKLREHDGKPGWWRDGMTHEEQHASAMALLRCLYEEAGELTAAIGTWHNWMCDENVEGDDPSFILAVLNESADVANYASVIADVVSRATVLGVQGLINGRGVNIDSFPKRRVLYALHPTWLELLHTTTSVVMDLDVEQVQRNDETRWLYRPLSTIFTLNVDAFELESDAIAYAQKQLREYESHLLRQQQSLSDRYQAVTLF